MSTADRAIAETIQKYGWAVVRVEESQDEPGFAYSVGLYANWEHPEIIVFGLPLDIIQEIVNTIGDQVRHGARFLADSTSAAVLEGYECAFRKVSPAAYDRYMGTAVRFYNGREFPALHCIWPDSSGRFPWDPETTTAYRRLQPMLSEGPEPYTHTRPAP